MLISYVKMKNTHYHTHLVLYIEFISVIPLPHHLNALLFKSFLATYTIINHYIRALVAILVAFALKHTDFVLFPSPLTSLPRFRNIRSLQAIYRSRISNKMKCIIYCTHNSTTLMVCLVITQLYSSALYADSRTIAKSFNSSRKNHVSTIGRLKSSLRISGCSLFIIP